MSTPWVPLTLQDQLCVVVYEFSDDRRPFIALSRLDIMICLQSYNNEWYRGYSLKKGPNQTGIFPANRLRRLQLPRTTEKAKYVYWAIWLKILWSKFIDKFTSDVPATYQESMEKFDRALWCIHTGEEAGLIELANYLHCKVPPFVDGLCNDWRNISFTELKELTAERKTFTKHNETNPRVLSLEIKNLVMGYELRQGAKGFLLVYLFDESRGHQLSETSKIPFVTDKLGRIPKLGSLRFIDLKQTSVKPSINMVFRILLEAPINEQKKTTTPIYKLAYWGCFKVAEAVKCMNSQLSNTSNVTLVQFHSGDKVDFSSKRHSKLHYLSRQQFLSYRISWVEQEASNQGTTIFLMNIGEILRSPPLIESKLYLTLHSGWFERGRKSSEKNVEVTVSVVDGKEEVISKAVVEGHTKKPFYRSSVTRHCNTPQWSEMITIAMSDSAFKECFVKFECCHVTSSELTQKSSLKWISYLPLSTQVGNVIPNATYTLKLLPKNTYISKDLWEDDVLIRDENAATSKHLQRLTVITQLDSSTLTDTAAIHKIKSWNIHSKDLKAILKQLNLTDFSKCVEHCQQIFTSILEIIDSCVDGEIIAGAMSVLFSFSRFWSTNDEFKSRLLDSMKKVTFVSGLLKFVAWMKFVIQDQSSIQFRQTVKSLSLLLTIMSKSFVNLRKSELMALVETDRYKVILANMLVEISHIEVNSNVILCNQIIKVFPEALKVLYSDGIISINEFSFHMISIMKGSILSVLKDSAATRVAYIDHLKLIVTSDFIKDKDLQMRYFQDLTQSLALQDIFTQSDIDTMASVVVRFSEAYMPVIAQQSSFFKEIVALLQSYLTKIESNPDADKTLETRLTSLSLISALFDILLISPEDLKFEASRSLENAVKLVRNVVKVGGQSIAGSQVDHAVLCKKLDLASKILSYSARTSTSNLELISDITFIVASLLGEPIKTIDQNNAPTVAIYSRIQDLHDQLFDFVQNNLYILCKNGHFDASLIDPVVAMGLLKPGMDWLFKFIEIFLNKFPERLNEVLSSIHFYKDNLKSNSELQQTTDISSDLPSLVRRQVYLLQSVAFIAEKTQTFDIENVENLVSLIKFYSKHQCWIPFKETANIYKDVLIRSEAFLEAAELTEYSCNLAPNDIISGKEDELFTAASYYTEAGLWSKALEVLKTLQIDYEVKKSKNSYLKLSEVSEKCKVLYTNLAEKPVIPFHYFLVGLYGNEVPKSFQNKLYIFRGNPLESIMDFAKRIMLKFPGYEQIGSAKLPTPEEIAKFTKAFQIIKVNPLSNKDQIQIDDTCLKFNKFSFELCSVKDKSIKNELLRMNYQRFTFEIDTPLPSYIPFCELSSLKFTNVSPIEMAIEQIGNKSSDLKLEAQKFSTEEGNINQFQMKLNGTIDAAVNGGTNRVRETFLDGEFLKSNPDSANLCEVLQDEINRQKVIVTECLCIHDKVCPENLRMLHEKMVHQHENREFRDSTCPEESLDGAPVLATPQRNALLNEIARRGSKLKKNTKMNRVKSVFFESQPKRTSFLVSPEKAAVPEIEETKSGNVIDTKEFENTYALLCTQLNQDFNLHMLPRYSAGRRETMSKPMSRPTRLGSKMPSMEKALHIKSSGMGNNIVSRYSSRKELKDEVFEGPPELPPKSKLAGKTADALKQTHEDMDSQQSALFSVPLDDEEGIVSSSTQENTGFSPNSSALDAAGLVYEDNGTTAKKDLQRRCNTIERSYNIKPPTVSISASCESDSSISSADPLKLDLKSLATAFNLSPDEQQQKRKISKDDFDAKVRRNLTLNELKKNGSEQI